MALTRDAILAKSTDPEVEEVPIPEWDDSVFVKGMSGAERDAFEMSSRRKGETDLRNYRARFLVRTLVDESGKRLFRDEDAPTLGKHPSRIISRMFDAASRLSGMDDEEVEEAEGNSEEETAAMAAGSDSPSFSPATSAAHAQSFSPAPTPVS
ncbi:hypothetical protein RVR_8324 [Actinacidiphila reveromycinica]|uniref:Uncharacterized protein n=1 Tax=Actinacidiphila reveromycinica TaxID=659352 RepID=A0A7U3UYG4_9ACTN|nr:hypothetical protein [Streptomyces sp. SN-593]BBB01078.1 hypothetical protein RVR_8324 [Streptomyces sp. SN-593]